MHISGDSSDLHEGVVLGAGNPLLDISANVTPEFLAKYGLERDNAILYDKEDIYDDVLATYGHDVEYSAGGATQNSMRVAQWILGKAKCCTYIGSVGRDKNSEQIKASAEASGLSVHYEYQEGQHTGKCAVLITGDKRSLVTKLDAANSLQLGHVKDHWHLVERANIFYSSGYFLTVCPEAMAQIAQHALESSQTKKYVLNLGAPFIATVFHSQLMKVFSRAHIVIGNEEEAVAFATRRNYPDPHDMTKVALAMAAEPYTDSQSDVHRLVVVTRGAEPLICVERGVATEYQVTQVNADDIVDTNGAGDAFVGGFLAQLARGKSTAECIRCAIWAATVIIQRSGCTFPDKMDFV